MRYKNGYTTGQGKQEGGVAMWGECDHVAVGYKVISRHIGLIQEHNKTNDIFRVSVTHVDSPVENVDLSVMKCGLEGMMY